MEFFSCIIRSPALFVSVSLWCLAAAIMLALSLNAVPKTTQIARVGKKPGLFTGSARARLDFMKNSRELVAIGYRKYKDSPYSIQTTTVDYVVISDKYLPELQKLSPDYLSSKDAHYERHMSYWTGMDSFMHSDLHRKVVLLDLTQNLHSMVQYLATELCNGWAAEVKALKSEKKDFVRVRLHHTTKKVVSAAMYGVFFGKEQALDSRWFVGVRDYIAGMSQMAGKLRSTLPMLRPIRYVMLWPAKKTMRQGFRRAQDFLFGPGAPLRMNRALMELTPAAEKDEKNLSVLRWMTARARGSNDDNEQMLTSTMLLLTMASLDSTSIVITNVTLDLCAYPEWIAILREEIEQAIGAEGGWTLKAVQRMEKLGSFVKESMRMNPNAIFNVHYKVKQRVRLSDGLILPAGAFIAISGECVAHDPEYFPEPDTFQPMRFFCTNEPRAADNTVNTGQSSSHKSTVRDTINLGFGFGVSACPGRHFAICMVKLAIARLICRYHIQYPESQTDRPSNVVHDEWIRPNEQQEVEISLRENSM